MNCYGLPGSERAYYRLAHLHRTVLNVVPYHQSGAVEQGWAPRWTDRKVRLDGLGSPLRAVFRRHRVRRFAAPRRAAGMLLSAAERKLADAHRRQLQRRLLGRPCVSEIVSRQFRRGVAADGRAFQRPRLERYVLPMLLQRQEQFQIGRLVARFVAVAVGRAGPFSGLLGPAIFRRRVSRRREPRTKKFARQGQARFPLRHFAARVATRFLGRPAGLQRRRRRVSAIHADGERSQRGPRAIHARIRRQQRHRRFERAAGRLVDRFLEARQRRRVAVAGGRQFAVVEARPKTRRSSIRPEPANPVRRRRSA